jgi:Response regulator of the LytR/AlgR family
MLRAIVVDDEVAAIKSVELIIQRYCPEVEMVGSAMSVETGIELIFKVNPDVVFLDVQMPRGTGFDLLEAIPERKFEIIFITAFNHYAVKAFKYSAVDYLLKPIVIEDFIEAVSKVKKLRSEKINNNSKYLALFENLNTVLPQKIVLPYMSGYEHVDLAGILYMEKSPDGVNVFTVDGKKWESTKDLHDFEEILVERSFFKVNQMVLVNLIHVSKVNKSLKTLTFSNGNAIEVSSNRLTLLLENLERLWNK